MGWVVPGHARHNYAGTDFSVRDGAVNNRYSSRGYMVSGTLTFLPLYVIYQGTRSHCSFQRLLYTHIFVSLTVTNLFQVISLHKPHEYSFYYCFMLSKLESGFPNEAYMHRVFWCSACHSTQILWKDTGGKTSTLPRLGVEPDCMSNHTVKLLWPYTHARALSCTHTYYYSSVRTSARVSLPVLSVRTCLCVCIVIWLLI